VALPDCIEKIDQGLPAVVLVAAGLWHLLFFFYQKPGPTWPASGLLWSALFELPSLNFRLLFFLIKIN
jgi:hypothetical protein